MDSMEDDCSPSIDPPAHGLSINTDELTAHIAVFRWRQKERVRST